MKKQIVKIAAIVAILFGGIASLTAQEIQIPFTEKKYKSDENYFRASSYGKSPDMTMAQSSALTNTKKVLAGLIETKVQSVIQIYTLQTESNTDVDFARETSELIKNTINQVLNDIHIMDEKAIRNGNVIEYYMVLEVPKKKVEEKMEFAITKEGFQLEKDKFEQIFDEEMSKYGNSDE